MKKKIIAMLAASALIIQSFAIPMMASAEITALPYITQTDFSNVAAAPGLPIRIDGNPWLYKGSAGTVTNTLEEENGQKYVHMTSDSVKGGNVGEGSWYFYYRNQKNPIEAEGWAKFDIRMNEGMIQFTTGTYTDPTKGGDVSANVIIDSMTKKITATAANGKINEIVPKMTPGEWYTVLIKYDCENLQYSVYVTDKDGKEYSAEDMAFVTAAAAKPIIFAFSYQRKSGPHNFDLTNLSIGKGTYDPDAVKPTEAPVATPEPTVAPTTAPSAAPTTEPTKAPAKEMKFTDVDGHWAKDYIAEMYQANIINGKTETSFEPESKITKAEFTKLIVAMLGLDVADATYTGACTDVSGDWYTAYIQAAEKASLIDANMVVDGKFNPNANISREEMASLVVAAAKAKSLAYDGGSVDAFPDKDSISPWAKDYVAGASKLGIVNGKEDGSFDPKADATRAEAATMISRLVKAIG